MTGKRKERRVPAGKGVPADRAPEKTEPLTHDGAWESAVMYAGLAMRKAYEEGASRFTVRVRHGSRIMIACTDRKAPECVCRIALRRTREKRRPAEMAKRSYGRVCAICGKAFTAGAPNAKYCSDACRAEARKMRKEAARTESWDPTARPAETPGAGAQGQAQAAAPGRAAGLPAKRSEPDARDGVNAERTKTLLQEAAVTAAVSDALVKMLGCFAEEEPDKDAEEVLDVEYEIKDVPEPCRGPAPDEIRLVAEGMRGHFSGIVALCSVMAAFAVSAMAFGCSVLISGEHAAAAVFLGLPCLLGICACIAVAAAAAWTGLCIRAGRFLVLGAGSCMGGAHCRAGAIIDDCRAGRGKVSDKEARDAAIRLRIPIVLVREYADRWTQHTIFWPDPSPFRHIAGAAGRIREAARKTYAGLKGRYDDKQGKTERAD